MLKITTKEGPAAERRNKVERRENVERRKDFRAGIGSRKLSPSIWIKMILRPRLGVDRRKGIDRRSAGLNLSQISRAVLSAEELDYLLK